MSRYSDQIRDEYGRPVPGVSIYVYKWDAIASVAGDLETLTDDMSAPLTNPVISDDDGLFYFNSADGQKLLEFHFGGKVRERDQILVGPLPTRPLSATGTAPPTTGAHVTGEITLNSAPAAGGPVGWVCLAGGTPGTWAPFGTIGAAIVSGTPYLGVAATRAMMLGDTLGAGFPQAISRTAHFARDSLTSFQLLFSDWCGGGEVGAGAPTTVSAVIEYPIGVARTRVTFSGSDDGTLASGATLLSDAITLAIPNGAKFYIRQFKRNANGFLYNQYYLANAALGDIVQIAASGLTDNLITGDPAGNAPYIMAPAVISMTTNPSVLIIGDSRAAGVSDTAGGNALGDAGEIARSIGANYAYIQCGLAGEAVASAVGNSTKRQSIAQYVTHVGSNYGINDVRGGALVGTIESLLQTLWAEFGPDRYMFQTTIAPSELTGSPESTNGVRTGLNDWLRANASALTGGLIELADVVESSRNSGLWKSGYTTDLIHENATGYGAIESAGIFPTLSLPPANPYPGDPANVLFFPTALSNAAWTKEGITVAENAILAPSGMRSADTITATATTGEHRIYQGMASASYNKSVHAKPGTANFISIGGGTTGVPYAVFDLSTGTVSSVGSGATASIMPSVNGFYLCEVHGGAATTFAVVNIGDTAAHALPGASWAAAGTETVHLWQLQAV